MTVSNTSNTKNYTLIGLDLFTGNSRRPTVGERTTCLKVATGHVILTIVSPLFITVGIIGAVVSPIFFLFIGIDSINEHGYSKSQFVKIFKELLRVEITAIVLIASPILHTLAAVRCLAGAIIAPSIYLSSS